MLQLIWNRFAYIGVSGAPDQNEHKHIVLVNSLALMISAFTLVNIPLAVSIGFPAATLMVTAVYSVLLPFTLFFNSRGLFLFARIFFALSSLSFISFYAFCFGAAANFQLFLLSGIVVAFFIFPPHQRAWMFIVAGLEAASFAYFEAVHQRGPVLYVPPEILEKESVITSLSSAFLVLGFSYYVRNTFHVAEKYLHLEREKSERLLHNILPAGVVKKLRESPDTIAERFENCTVLFSDIVGFSGLARRMSAVEVVSLLNTIFSAFDDLAEKHGLEKIKTIGDAYMVVGGLPDPDPEHAERVARFALDMLDVVRDYRDKYDVPLELRIGVNSGDAVAGVIGKKKFIYDLWGDSVNTASRMESHGVPGQIQVTESTYILLREKFSFEERGSIEVKGLGQVKSYLLLAGAAA